MSGAQDDPNELERLGHALVAEGHELLAKAAELRKRAAPDEWIPVAASPLGRRRTLDLARRGVLENAKLGRRVLIRTASLHSYIEKHRRVPDVQEDEDLFGSEALAAELRQRSMSGRR